MEQQEKANLEQLKQAYEAGCIEVNGNVYELQALQHQKRVPVFAFFSTIGEEVATGNLSFLTDDRWVGNPKYGIQSVEKIIANSVTFNGMLLSRLPEHWNDYPEDYVEFCIMALGVISYPFLRGKLTASQSAGNQAASNLLSKPT